MIGSLPQQRRRLGSAFLKIKSGESIVLAALTLTQDYRAQHWCLDWRSARSESRMGAGGCAHLHVNKPKWRVGARGLFSSGRKGNIPPTSGSIIGSLSSLPSLHTLISLAGGRGKSQARQ